MALALATQTHRRRAWSRVWPRLSCDRDAVDDILYVMVPITWLSSPLFALGGSSGTTLGCWCLWGLCGRLCLGSPSLTAHRVLWAGLTWWTWSTLTLRSISLLSLSLGSISL